MEARISIVTLGVKDLERSVKFYRDGLGLPTDYASGNIAFFQTLGTQLALHPHEALADDAMVSSEGHGFQGFTIAHNTSSREEVDHVMAEARAAGATIVKPAQNAFWGGYSGYFSDPDNFLWEVAWNPYFKID